ncbi:MAG: hypothetical protein LBG87_10205 [Spirochaetaceae bacterium]|nr:hypothetical protein [Spirochaetaceae bacterium]
MKRKRPKNPPNNAFSAGFRGKNPAQVFIPFYPPIIPFVKIVIKLHETYVFRQKSAFF